MTHSIYHSRYRRILSAQDISDMTSILWAHVRRTLVNGLLLLIPVALTYLVVRFLFDLVDGMLQPSTRWALAQFGVDWTLPGPGILAAVLLIYLVGLCTAFGLGKYTVDLAQKLLRRVPFIGTIYSTNHQLIESFSGTRATGFQRVVLVEFPRDKTWSIGFLTGFSDAEGVDKLVMVYVPTAPFPNSGFVIFLPPEGVLDTDLSVPDAMQLVFSGGVVSPAAIKTSRIDISVLENEFQPTVQSFTDGVKDKTKTKAAESGHATRNCGSIFAASGPESPK